VSKIYPHPCFEDVRIIQLDAYTDERGWMARISDEDTFRTAGIPCEWNQISHSHTLQAGILRGVFVSLPPNREGKLVRVLRGRMQWVLVDLRVDSKTFGKWGEVLLDEKDKNAFYAPKGFAHGCLCLEDKTDLLLMADCRFDPTHATGISWDDSTLGIGWRLAEVSQLRLSEAHKAYPGFADYCKRHTSQQGGSG